MLAANKQLAAATFRQQQALLLAADERARLVRELLGGIKVIKLQASELRFEERIQHARAAEVRAMKRLHTYAARTRTHTRTHSHSHTHARARAHTHTLTHTQHTQT